MYESPIKIIQEQWQAQMEGAILKAVCRYGIYVDKKEELLKALKYDRDQYRKGYEDGLNANKWIPCSERLPEKFEDVLVITDNDIQRVWNLTESYGQLLWEDEYGYWSPFENVIAWMPLPQPYKEGE